MNKRSAPAAETVTIEKFLISNYVRLCIAEGTKPRDAYKQLKKRLEAIKELKDPKNAAIGYSRFFSFYFCTLKNENNQNRIRVINVWAAIM